MSINTQLTKHLSTAGVGSNVSMSSLHIFTVINMSSVSWFILRRLLVLANFMCEKEVSQGTLVDGRHWSTLMTANKQAKSGEYRSAQVIMPMCFWWLAQQL